MNSVVPNARVDLGSDSRALSSQQQYQPSHSQAEGMCVGHAQPTCFLHLPADSTVRSDFCLIALITAILFPVAGNIQPLSQR